MTTTELVTRITARIAELRALEAKAPSHWHLRQTGPVNKKGLSGSANIEFGVFSVMVFTDKGLDAFTWQIYCGGIIAAGSEQILAEACNKALRCFDEMLRVVSLARPSCTSLLLSLAERLVVAETLKETCSYCGPWEKDRHALLVEIAKGLGVETE